MNVFPPNRQLPNKRHISSGQSIMTRSQFSLTLALPAQFNTHDVFAFHGRDPAQIAEKVTGNRIHKGILWQNIPACLTLEFLPFDVRATLVADGDIDINPDEFAHKIRRMLGLTQVIDDFEAACCGHPQLGSLIERHRGLRVPLTVDAFEALIWAIIGQLISVSAAVAIRRRFIQLFDRRHSGGLLCHPQASDMLNAPESALYAVGLTKNKTNAITSLCAQIVNNQLPLELWENAESLPVEAIYEQLLAISGIGPWTVNYVLLRGFGWLDGSLHGDAAVRRNLQTLLRHPEKLSAEETKIWLDQFSPWRALVAAYLWKIDANGGY